MKTKNIFKHLGILASPAILVITGISCSISEKEPDDGKVSQDLSDQKPKGPSQPNQSQTSDSTTNTSGIKIAPENSNSKDIKKEKEIDNSAKDLKTSPLLKLEPASKIQKNDNPKLSEDSKKETPKVNNAVKSEKNKQKPPIKPQNNAPKSTSSATNQTQTKPKENKNSKPNKATISNQNPVSTTPKPKKPVGKIYENITVNLEGETFRSKVTEEPIIESVETVEQLYKKWAVVNNEVTFVKAEVFYDSKRKMADIVKFEQKDGKMKFYAKFTETEKNRLSLEQVYDFGQGDYFIKTEFKIRKQ
ncbi:Uncharacterised protein [Mycoplasmopsis citelli]|uniref:Lipoprotein n=1 Tax=Mycoplasmopsis citelli TaxID=171281 RepID=A0A449B1J3_9BACT|nr:hypothetical protein [Mycoplasmopsis citelli]VEU74470.1 Uncharacterised protein [Mycoplasmopsis citelli]